MSRWTVRKLVGSLASFPGPIGTRLWAACTDKCHALYKVCTRHKDVDYIANNQLSAMCIELAMGNAYIVKADHMCKWLSCERV